MYDTTIHISIVVFLFCYRERKQLVDAFERKALKIYNAYDNHVNSNRSLMDLDFDGEMICRLKKMRYIKGF